MPLDTAITETVDQGKGYSLRDATDLGRYISPARTKDFKVCFEQGKPELSAVDLFVVPRAEKCPDHLGDDDAATPDETPKIIGMSVRKAVGRLEAAGFRPDNISVRARDEKGRESTEPHWGWKVCAQTPAPGTPFAKELKPRLVVRASCAAS